MTNPRTIVEQFEIQVSVDARGQRVDRYLADRLPDLSRSYIQKLIREGLVTVGGRAVKASRDVKGGENVAIQVPEAEELSAEPEDIPLRVLYEDDALIVVDKPAGMVVHPAYGHARGTLVNALAFRCRNLSGVGGPLRPGIVHRLDRDTSGVIVVAKNDSAHRRMSEQFASRSVSKQYLAIVRGAPKSAAFSSDASIGRHPKMRLKMVAMADGGREARTDFESLASANGLSIVLARPRTGRTHQIRVHLARLGLPILCDPLYGREASVTASELRGARPAAGEVPALARQALHAHRIEFSHPVTGERLRVVAQPAEDFAAAARIILTSISPDDRPKMDGEFDALRPV